MHASTPSGNRTNRTTQQPSQAADLYKRQAKGSQRINLWVLGLERPGHRIARPHVVLLRALKALLGRIPERVRAAAPGFRAAALVDRVYPGLVVSAVGGSASGVVLTDLSNEEWRILDAFEDEKYDLREVTLSTGATGWAYIWPGGDVCSEDWDAAAFEAHHLPAYAERFTRLAPRVAAGKPKGS
ncbi:gamma-glutamylcyclotransferase family protein [Streptomyces sp. NPDC002285]